MAPLRASGGVASLRDWRARRWERSLRSTIPPRMRQDECLRIPLSYQSSFACPCDLLATHARHGHGLQRLCTNAIRDATSSVYALPRYTLEQLHTHSWSTKYTHYYLDKHSSKQICACGLSGKQAEASIEWSPLSYYCMRP